MHIYWLHTMAIQPRPGAGGRAHSAQGRAAGGHSKATNLRIPAHPVA